LAVHSSTGKSKAVLNTIYKKTTSHWFLKFKFVFLELI
jgi:hypothetical protein